MSPDRSRLEDRVEFGIPSVGQALGRLVTGMLNGLPRLHTRPIKQIVSLQPYSFPYRKDGRPNLGERLRAYMPSALIDTRRGYPAMLLAEQLAHHRSVPSRSSRTRESTPQASYARGG